MLVEFIRETLDLTGTHIGCDTTFCGACTVLLNGKSQVLHGFRLPGPSREITTVEGLANGDELHPAQKAFAESHGLQCGYCTPGFLMSTAYLLSKKKNPTEKEIRKGIAGNTCRCTGYQNILKAIRAAAAENGNGRHRMKIQFGGDFTVQRKPEDVYDFLVDPEKFCPLLPDYQSMQKVRRQDVQCQPARRDFSYPRHRHRENGTHRQTPPNHAVYEGKGDVPGGTATLRAGFDLTPDASNGTKVTWKGEGQIAGRLPSIAGGLLEPLAKKNVQKLIDALQGALSV